jgi:hypothetical protein
MEYHNESLTLNNERTVKYIYIHTHIYIRCSTHNYKIWTYNKLYKISQVTKHIDILRII